MTSHTTYRYIGHALSDRAMRFRTPPPTAPRIGAAGQPLRRVARRAALAGVAALALGREVDQYRRPVGRLLAFPHNGRVEMDSLRLPVDLPGRIACARAAFATCRDCRALPASTGRGLTRVRSP